MLVAVERHAWQDVAWQDGSRGGGRTGCREPRCAAGGSQRPLIILQQRSHAGHSLCDVLYVNTSLLVTNTLRCVTGPQACACGLEGVRGAGAAAAEAGEAQPEAEPVQGHAVACLAEEP